MQPIHYAIMCHSGRVKKLNRDNFHLPRPQFFPLSWHSLYPLPTTLVLKYFEFRVLADVEIDLNFTEVFD